ncbi:HAD family hydrolase [Kovacikia minuta CCNUW1]|uniref:HAD family hydrolase n=1 Tax=Kovacikia minuta TaxID=2931930 RepID=UPI001CCD3036|nr:HAD family hydrolase [Kovacikia minuta]UBF25765.1 HAD family hydrolase [Kovacikia minuta CCNUW1]
MSASFPTVLALDFDGVICNGLKEYFQTAWQAYCNLWQVENQFPPSGVAEQFYRLRPVVETGWEMPVLVRAIMLGIPEADIFQNWIAVPQSGSAAIGIAQQILQQDNLNAAKCIAEVDGIRDRWIASDPDSWLAEQTFYPGVIDRLKSTLASPTIVVIVSTKEKRFIEQLLQQQNVDLTNLRIFGKEVKRPKHQVLRELIAEYGSEQTFWFVEDRLKTLQGIQLQPDLETVSLFLADWGYNTTAERELAASNPHINLISLKQFSQDFLVWMGEERVG